MIYLYFFFSDGSIRMSRKSVGTWKVATTVTSVAGWTLQLDSDYNNMAKVLQIQIERQKRALIYL